MVRQIITITDSQRKWIDQQAKSRGISITEVIRRLVDAEMEKTKDGTDRPA